MTAEQRRLMLNILARIDQELAEARDLISTMPPNSTDYVRALSCVIDLENSRLRAEARLERQSLP